ncbi:hypothetical protein LMG28138_01322 [Pararobbsia alpina]|uniref:Secreted protein n=1 Tax=Pararobbsia alpina TaxID=621374 RepID=A0A6S7C5L9_9BURK|nr:hypothetical protein LMG28138_01322 [Pararobbsia alpina]
MKVLLMAIASALVMLTAAGTAYAEDAQQLQPSKLVQHQGLVPPTESILDTSEGGVPGPGTKTGESAQNAISCAGSRCDTKSGN